MNLPSINNARDLFGMPLDDLNATTDARTVHAHLIRCGSLEKLSAQDATTLQQGANVKLVIDLRTAQERAEKPDGEIPGARRLELPIFDEATVGITHEGSTNKLGNISERVPDLQKLYATMMDDACAQRFGQALRAIANCAEGEGVLYHCTAGKDRTGVLTALLLMLLGCDRKTIETDYLATNANLTGKARKMYLVGLLLGRSKATAEKLRSTFIAKQEYLQVVLDTVDACGGIDAFATKHLGLSSSEIAQLRDRCLALAATKSPC